ncbi:MAG: molybdopterin-guanine dinucleotide biosynthesis protein A [Desulforhopalus sp.]|jgi:molybdopterin-guanine dinucleotide biosynthesis protein A
MDRPSLADKMLQFPVFQLYGGSESQRNDFLGKLQNECDQRHLSMTVVQKSLPQRFELFALAQHYDLVIVDGLVDYPTHEIYFGCSGNSQESDLICLDAGVAIEEFLEKLLKKLEHIILQTPVWACILIGGRSSRMGQPKHLLTMQQGSTESWIERTVRLVQPHVGGLVVSGKGELPLSLEQVQRIPDIPGVAGPLTGLLSAMRWQPGISWLVIACDMPFISDDAINWLLKGRRPGCWGRLPRLRGSDFCEPLFSLYEGRTAHLLEDQLLTGNLRVGKIGKHHKIDNPAIPEELCSAWKNVNTPEQLQSAQFS